LLGLAEARNDRPMLINAIRGLGMILLFMGQTRHVVRRHNRSRAPPSGWLIASRKATPNPQAPLIWEMSAEL